MVKVHTQLKAKLKYALFWYQSQIKHCIHLYLNEINKISFKLDLK